MSEDVEQSAREAAWDYLKPQLDPEKHWTVGDSATYHGFFSWGWEARRQKGGQDKATPASTGAEPCQHNDMWRRDLLLSWRGIDPSRNIVCRDCDGSGAKVYGGASTWRGGIGGQMMTRDVCDKCWGSGQSDQPWTNLRELKASHPPAQDEAADLQSLLADIARVNRDVPDAIDNDGEAYQSAALDAAIRVALAQRGEVV